MTYYRVELSDSFMGVHYDFTSANVAATFMFLATKHGIRDEKNCKPITATLSAIEVKEEEDNE